MIRLPQPRVATNRAQVLRAEFDQSFSVAVHRDTDPQIDVLTFRIDDGVYAIRLTDVLEMAARPVITRVPAGIPALLGLAAARGRVVAAYDVSRLLGGTGQDARWMVVPAAQPSVGLAFDRFEGHRRIRSADGAVTEAGQLLGMDVLLGAIRALNPGSPPPHGDQS